MQTVFDLELVLRSGSSPLTYMTVKYVRSTNSASLLPLCSPIAASFTRGADKVKPFESSVILCFTRQRRANILHSTNVSLSQCSPQRPHSHRQVGVVPWRRV